LPGRTDETLRAARVVELEAERKTARFDHARCYLLEELAEVVAPADAEKRFDELLAPIFAGPRVDLRQRGDILCRVRVALSMRDVPAPRRVGALVRILSAEAPVLAPRCEGSHAIRPPDEDRYELLHALLTEHQTWIDTSSELRAWLFTTGTADAVHAMWVYNW